MSQDRGTERAILARRGEKRMARGDRRVRPGGGSGNASAAVSTLTSREKRVLERLLLGERNKEIARKLGCTVKNVEYHVANILRRTGMQSRLKLVATMARSN